MIYLLAGNSLVFVKGDEIVGNIILLQQTGEKHFPVF